MMPTVRPVLREISFTSAARARWSSAVPCEKLSRTTSTPARTMRSSTAGSDEAGPSVATILVLRSISASVSAAYPARASSAATAGSVLPSRNSRKAPPAVEM